MLQINARNVFWPCTVSRSMLPCTLSMTPSMTGESLSVTCGPTWMPSKRPNISFKIFGVADDMEEPPAADDMLRIATPCEERRRLHALDPPPWTGFAADTGCPKQERCQPPRARAWRGTGHVRRTGTGASRPVAPRVQKVRTDS